MSSFGKRLLDHQDDPSATASNIGSCTKKAKISSEPTFKNTENQEHCPVNLDVVGKGKQKAVSASQTINPQDPFDVFDADIVRMIITELDAPHTETLRRVSKLWKATSESHCGRTFLRQHFPEVAASLSEDEVGSVKEENLRFRRHLYYHQSFQLGYATRAFRCTGASSWDLKNDTVVWSNSDGEVSFRTLKVDSAGVQDSAQVNDEKLDLRRVPIPFFYVEQVWQLKGGDLIVQSFVRHDRRRPRRIKGQRNPSGVRSIARVNKAGQVLWEITTCPRTWSKPAIGEKELFFIMESPIHYTVWQRNNSDPKLIKYSLQDGLVVPGFGPVRQEHRFKQMNLSANALFLTSDERFAIWTDVDDIVSIISVSNRENVCQFLKNPAATVYKSLNNKSLWVVNQRLQDAATDLGEDDWISNHPRMAECSYFLSWKDIMTDFHVQLIRFPAMLRYSSTKWVFETDSAALLRKAIASRPEYPFNRRPRHLQEGTAESLPKGTVEDRTVPLGRVIIAATHQLPSDSPEHIQLETKTAPVEVSLPTSGGQPGQRRPLEVDVLFEWKGSMWADKDEGYFRMAEKYLLFHLPNEEVLFLIDFWPSW